MKRKEIEIENEIMKMKLQAESGARIGIRNDIPPEVENAFLHNVMAIEKASRGAKMVTVYELLGSPSFRPLEEISPENVKEELDYVLQLMAEKRLVLDILDVYDDAVIYKFITTELFRHQVQEEVMTGVVRHFIYEEFHPSHRIDIRERTMDFLGGWFERKMDDRSWELSPAFVLPDETIYTREQVINKIKTIFAAYTAFIKCQYAIGDISFEWNEQQSKGLGYCEGAVKYQAVLESGEVIPVEGPFKLYMSNEGRWWHIFYFVFPGFTW
jgi:hypothetical protein